MDDLSNKVEEIKQDLSEKKKELEKKIENLLNVVLDILRGIEKQKQVMERVIEGYTQAAHYQNAFLKMFPEWENKVKDGIG